MTTNHTGRIDNNACRTALPNHMRADQLGSLKMSSIAKSVDHLAVAVPIIQKGVCSISVDP